MNEYHNEVSVAEKTAFVKHINATLNHIKDLSNVLPLDPNSDEIFEAVKSGILLCHLVNSAIPCTIDTKKIISKFTLQASKVHLYLQNHVLALEGANKIKVKTINVGPEDLLEANPKLVCGIIWQIIKIAVLKNISSTSMTYLKEDDEDLVSLPAEDLLLKWANWHLKQSGSGISIDSFDSENSLAYLFLMNHLNPSLNTLDSITEKDALKRAQVVVNQASVFGCDILSPEDIVSGNGKLNLMFTASLFNEYSGESNHAKSFSQNIKKENENLKLRIEELEIKNNDLFIEHKLIHNRYKDVETQFKKDSEELKELKLKYQELKEQSSKESDDLQAKISKLFQVNERLTVRIRSLDSEKRSVQALKDSIKLQYDEVNEQLNHTNEELERERLCLESSEESGQTLAEELESLRKSQEKLMFMIESMKSHRQRAEIHASRLRVLYASFPTTELLVEKLFFDLSLDNIRSESTFEGYLTKKARNSNTWAVRYFVLRDNFLFYYKTDKDSKALPHGVVRLDDCDMKFSENPTKKTLNENSIILCIEVPHHSAKKEIFSFYLAGSSTELSTWKVHFQTASKWWTYKATVGQLKRSASVKLR